MSLLDIGCGKMGGALVSRWANKTGTSITVADRSLEIVPPGSALVNKPSELEGMLFDKVVIAVKPQVVGEVVPQYLPYIREGACVPSIAAGISIESLVNVVGDRAVIRMMPNLPAEIGKSVTGYFGNDKSSPADIAFAKLLTECVGLSLQVSQEEDLDKVTVVAGSGTGYAFEIIRCWVEAAEGEAIGLSPSVSREIVLATVRGGQCEIGKYRSTSKLCY